MDTLLVLVLSSLKAMLLLAAASGATFVFRGRPPRLRAVVWGTALAGCLMLPVVAPIVPSWNISLPLNLELFAAQEETLPAMPLATHGVVTESEDPALERGLPPVSQAPSASFRTDWQQVLVIFWGFGALLLSLHLATGLWRVSRILRCASLVEESCWRELLEAAAAQVGCRRRVRLRTSADIEIPATVGVVRPVVLLPLHAQYWTEERRRTVLLHEMVHIKRFDWAVRMMARVVRAAYWFNPLSWWAVRSLDLEQEMACDEEVLALGTPARIYACHLLSIARTALRSPAFAIPSIAMARTPNLEKRIMAILKRSAHTKVGLAVLLPVILLVAAMVPALAAVYPGNAEPVETGSELKEILAEMHQVEERFEPQLKQIEELEIDLEPQLERIEAIELEIDHEALAEIELRMAPYLERIAAIEVDMAPLHEHMEKLELELEDLQIHIEDGTLAEVQQQIHEQVEKHMAQFENIHSMIEPHLLQVEGIHVEMEELHRHMEDIHREIEPSRRQLETIHKSMEPFHKKMEEMHRGLEPLHEEMERLGERFQQAMAGEVERVLRTHLSGVIDPSTSLMRRRHVWSRSATSMLITTSYPSGPRPERAPRSSPISSARTEWGPRRLLTPR